MAKNELTVTHGVAVVTGASGGIGEAFARALAAKGHDLVLVARRDDRLQALATSLRATGRKVDCIAADLAEANAPAEIWAKLDALGIAPTMWVNNAGVGRNISSLELTDAAVIQMVRLNIEAVTLLTLEASRRMVKQGRGAVINVSSTGAFQALPYMSVYAATKGYELLFSEAVNEELRGTGVRIFTVCPGYTSTDFHQLAGVKSIPPPSMRATPELCVQRALASFDAGRDVHIDGMANALMAFMGRLLPRRTLVKASAGLMKP